MGTISALKADDLFALPDPAEGGLYELSEGELIEVKGASTIHEDVKSMIDELLTAWNLTSRLGRIYVETMFRLAEDTARRPDVAFVSHQRRSVAQDRTKLPRFIPELAVEVISESERVGEARKKVHQYFQAGVLEVWQVYPEFQAVEIRTPSGVRELQSDQALETPVLPGFSVKVSEFFVG